MENGNNEDEVELMYAFPPGTDNSFPSDTTNVPDGPDTVSAEAEVLLGVKSKESMYSWNTGDAEILILATIINQTIHP